MREMYGFKCHRLFAPGHPRDVGKDPGLFAVDNFCFCKWSAKAFWGLLDRLAYRKSDCLFVSCPDVVGSGRRTLEIFEIMHPQLATWPVALVMQDGIENLDIPWRQFDAVFIGGTDRFKLSKDAADIIKAAQILGKWTHVGRVNSRDRWDKFEALGVDSCDGSGISRLSRDKLPKFIEPQLQFTGIIDANHADVSDRDGA